MGQGSLEFDSTATDEAIAGCDGDLGFFADQIGRLGCSSAVYLDFTSHDGGLGLLASGKMASLNQSLIESGATRHGFKRQGKPILTHLF